MTLDNAGFLAIEHGDFQEAANIFLKSFKQTGTATAYYGFGLASLGLEDYPAARWAFYKALELSPEHPEAALRVAEMEAPGFGAQKKLPPRAETYFRVGKGRLEVWQEGEWRKLFIKGVNLGLGLPGFFPGEYPIRKKTYLNWFEQMSGVGVNAVRIYTIHPPSFYEALDEWNRVGKRLFLLQGIWAETPEESDFSVGKLSIYAQVNVREAVDVIHGNITLPPRQGHPEGKYTADVSWRTLGFVYGREWEPCFVKQFNESQKRKRGGYKGRFLSISDGEPFEVWITEMCNFIQQYESERYNATRPCSATNWPTLDPLVHPSESVIEEERIFLGKEVNLNVCTDSDDMESLDVARIKSVSGGGFFASYHVYPYHPGFMSNDYLSVKEPYLAYLEDLKAHHGDQPVLVAEFGVPSSRDSVHLQKNGWNHGGHNEERQGEINALQMQAINRVGMAGGVLFSWFDEWFKKNWAFSPYYLPAERRPLWFNLQDPEKNYGLLAAYPGYPGKKVTLSGNLDEWKEAQVLCENRSVTPALRLRDGGDDARTLVRLRAQHDEGFLYLLLETKGPVDFEKAAYAIGINTCAPNIGEFLFPFDTRAKSPIGLQFLVHLAGERKSRILIARNYDRFLNIYRAGAYPVRSDEGAWVAIMNRSNQRRVSKDKSRFFPSNTQYMSGLRHGRLDSNHPDFDSLADFCVSGALVELRIPWMQLNFTDPSSRSIMWIQGGDERRTTEGVRATAISYRPRQNSPAALFTGGETNAADLLPRVLDSDAVKLYTWDAWDVPVYHMRPKKSFEAYKKVLSTIPEAE